MAAAAAGGQAGWVGWFWWGLLCQPTEFGPLRRSMKLEETDRPEEPLPVQTGTSVILEPSSPHRPLYLSVFQKQHVCRCFFPGPS